ncbi:MAG: histidine phosphatase family protein [Ruminococcaceae bacterium]|nr:histidine phosphatase family protein [Oscillospiraceae bacterium]
MENNDTLQIIFIRHAQTDYDDIGDRDPSDGELTAEGEQQCLALGEKLKGLSIDAYITSSLLRSFKTAVGVCKTKSDEPLLEICPELVECGCTPGYYGCSEEYLKKYYKNTKMCEKLFGTESYEFGCEAFEDNIARAEKVISYIKNRFSYGNRVAVFSHHGFLEYLIPTALGVKPHIFRFSLDNTSMSVVDFCRDGNVVLRSVNEQNDGIMIK